MSLNFGKHALYLKCVFTYVTECIVYMFRAMINPFSPVLFLSDWVGVLWPQLSKVLKPVRWAGSFPFPPVSLQRQVVCLLLRPVFISGESLHCFLVDDDELMLNVLRCHLTY